MRITYTGTILGVPSIDTPAGPIAAVARFTPDAAGNVIGSQTVNFDGNERLSGGVGGNSHGESWLHRNSHKEPDSGVCSVINTGSSPNDRLHKDLRRHA